MNNQPNHEAGADAAASSMRGLLMKTYPRLSVRRNARGLYEAYLIKHPSVPEVYLSTGPTIAGALWWVRVPPKPVVPVRCCLVGA